MPLHLFCKSVAISSYYRLLEILEFGWGGSYSNKTYSTSHMRFWRDTQLKMGIDPSTTDQCCKKLDSGSFKIKLDFKITNTPDHVELNFYTDGSKLNGKVGAGFLALEPTRIMKTDKFKLPDNSTVFQAEIFAILKATEYLSLIHI